MNPEELAREFEKTPKSLMKASPKQVLFADDYPEGRMQFVCISMDGDENSLNKVIHEILSQNEGISHIFRALNNLTKINHRGTLFFAKMCFQAIETASDGETTMLKFIQLLDAVSDELRTGMDWLNDRAASMLDASQSNDVKINVWLHWAAAVLRSNPTPEVFVNDILPRRPHNLSKTATKKLKEMFDNASWDIRSAALCLQLGNRLISIDKAQAFVDDAYACFPLEALEGIEILAIAVEDDAAKLAEMDVIQSKLMQIRRENLYLRDLPIAQFVEASECVFQNSGSLPDTPLKVALALCDLPKGTRLIHTAFIDDARRAEWIHIAVKNGVFKSLASRFFENIILDNPLCLEFSSDIVSTLLEHYHADAVKADLWLELVQKNDFETLKAELPWWIAFCKD
ncbi:MAG: hypothetical protein IJU23_12530 [Proteobacteria bacterium]|nr:hypothetical protein [Pseudomonadota bacterium]